MAGKPDSDEPQQYLTDLSEGTASSSFHRMLLDSLHDGVYFVDRERRITYWNQGAVELTGYDQSEAMGRHCFDNFLNHVDDTGCVLCFRGCPLAATLEDGQRRDAEIYLRHKSGHRIPVNVRVAPVRDPDGQVVGAVEVFSDISAKKSLERRADELECLAFRDPLTGIPNRRYIGLKVQQAIEEVQQFGRRFALLMIDIDHFKDVNDRYGHKTGDVVLNTVCKTLVHNLRPEDSVGRWGGDEFLMIAPNVSFEGLAAMATRFCNLIAESTVPVEDHRIQVSASVGATMLKAGEAAEEAIKRADTLMYTSKGSGRNQTTQG